MTPEEITALFATAAASFTPIGGQPTDDDLTALRDVLYPLLLDIPYDDQQGGTHNLIGLIEPTASYTATWGAAFPIPERPPAYPPIPDDATAVVRGQPRHPRPRLRIIQSGGTRGGQIYSRCGRQDLVP